MSDKAKLTDIDVTFEEAGEVPAEVLERLETRELKVRFRDPEEGFSLTMMPVPRCETCRHWQPGAVVRGKLRGNCHRIGISCNLDFGCVQWEGRA